MPQASTSNLDSVLGRLVVDGGLATQNEVDQCLQKKNLQSDDSAPNKGSLADMLIDSGFVTKLQLERIKPKLDEQPNTWQVPGFKFIKPLGAGAMAKVYLAKQLSLDRLVAIKVLPNKFIHNVRFVERFDAEGKAAAKLNHPNIVGALDVGKSGDTPYFVMEYVEGDTVYSRIEKSKRYDERQALNTVIQIAQALEHAHSMGLIHRDVKPKNIMITVEGIAKLADMGLARPVDNREMAEAERGKAFGTPYYISPEQIRGVVDVDFRADIYGLGATFYHMVTGHVPFDGDNPSGVMHKHLKEQLVPPDHINPLLSAGVCEIIEVCMAKDRDKRYNSSTDLIEDLESVSRGEPPAQARKKFDMVSLASLEASGTAEAPSPVAEIDLRQPLTEQPAFWFAIAGWLVAVIILLWAIASSG